MGRPTESMYYITDSNDSVFYNYDNEKILVDLNDTGIIRLNYQGIMTETEKETRIKLLKFDNVKESMIDAVKDYVTTHSAQTFGIMKLEYMRIPTDKEGSYVYIPIWRLGIFYGIDDPSLSFDSVESYMFINAIDGNRIDLDKERLTQDDMVYSNYDNWVNAR